jgi:hypothetical protein
VIASCWCPTGPIRIPATSRSFEEQFLALDARLVQSLGWYTGDLDDLIAAGVAQLPGMGPGSH